VQSCNRAIVKVVMKDGGRSRGGEWGNGTTV
jgi:hypothetical protein